MKKLIAILLSAALIFGSAVSVFAASSKGTAASVKLEKVTGKVTVTNASGKTVTTREGMLLYTGYKIKTGSKSSAYISLDSKTALMLESSSKMSLKKAGSKSEVMLESGTVVTDIAEKLPATNSVNIHTTNAVTGIRGTGVEVSYNPVLGATSLGMLEGSTDSFSKFLDSVVHADAGQGFTLGGAVQVTPLAGSITVGDLQPETRKIMIVDEDASGRVLTGFRETFGINGMTDQQKEDLKQDILNVVNEQGEKDESTDKAADDAAKTILDEGAVGSSSRPFEQVDPVFEDKDQTSASGAVSAASLPDEIPEDAPAETASSGSESSGGSSGGGSSETVNYTVSLYYEPAGTGAEPETIKVRRGSAASLPTEYDGSPIVCWCSDSELTTEFDPSTPITSSISLYARFEPFETHEVYFSYFPKDDVHFNSTMINVIHGLSVLDTVDAEDINSFPIYDDNGEETGEYITVEKWYIDENGKTEFDLSTAITENKTLYAEGYANNSPYTTGVFTFRIPVYDSEMFAVSVTSGGTAVSGESGDNYTSYSVEGDSVTVDVTLLAGSDFVRNGNGTGLQSASEYGISSSSVGASSDGLLMHYVFNEMPENGILYYVLDLTVDPLTDNNSGEITKFISGLQNSSIISSATISCYSGDEAALGELIGSYGNVSLGTPYHRVTFVYTENSRSIYDVKDGQKVERPSDSFEGDSTVVVSSWHVDSSPDAAEFDFDGTITSDRIIYSDLALVSKP